MSASAPTSTNRAYLALGSNIEPERNLPHAVSLLADRCRVLAVSRVYESAPIGFTEQANFLNAAALIETSLGAGDLKAEVLAEIESQLKRVRTDNKNAPRTIDLDIALFNRDVLEMGGRQIPDPEILEFGHIALPLADLDPDYQHPVAGRTLSEIAANFVGVDTIWVRPDIRLLVP